MEMTKKYYYVDMEYYDREDKDICGDMGFSFDDSPETRTEVFADALDMVVGFADEDIRQRGLDDEDIRIKEHIPIYYICSGLFTDDCDDEEEYYPGLFPDEGTMVRHQVIIYCSEEECRRLGINDLIGDIPILYIDPSKK